MSGHSKWATIKRKKGKNDAERGRIFTKLIKEIAFAARNGGGNPDTNARLRHAIDTAKSNSMPMDNVERAIKRGTGELEGVSYEEITYEGYAPGGVALLIESVTDNRNRTVSELRNMLSKNGGNLAEAGAVAWVFEAKGSISVDKSAGAEEDIFNIALEAGAEDMETDTDTYEITTPFGDLEAVRSALEAAGIVVASAEPAQIPTNTIKVEGKQAEQVMRLIETLDEHDDVQKIWDNSDIDEETLAEFAG
jgi:YebC/PmpR family DNA-binding regulatory protein